MAQHDYVIDNAPGAPVRNDLNSVLQAIASINSGSVEPTVMFPGMLWLDTAAGASWPNGRLRQRNLTNTAWLDLQSGNLPLTGGTVSGALTVNGLMTLAGGQVKFPASAVLSADANTLDDYAEKDFVPALTLGGLSTGITYGTRYGYSVKIGGLVWFSLELNLTSKGTATGQAILTGLPYAASRQYSAAPVGYYSNLVMTAGTDLAPTALVTGGNVNLYMQRVNSNALMMDTMFSATSRLIISGCYPMY